MHGAFKCLCKVLSALDDTMILLMVSKINMVSEGTHLRAIHSNIVKMIVFMERGGVNIVDKNKLHSF